LANGFVFKMNEFLCTVTSKTGTSGLACKKWHSIILLRLPVLKISYTKTSTVEHDLTWREERGMRVLWRIFAPKRGELTGEGGYLYSEELHILYASPYIIRMLKCEDELVM